MEYATQLPCAALLDEGMPLPHMEVSLAGGAPRYATVNDAE
ncbi:MAG: hypothetical protein ACHQ4H_10705 [Ktedonobacterales bacterium]|jgi:hypothetical protein